MKKVFLTLGCAVLLMLGACGSKNNETNADSDTVVMEEVEVTEVAVAPASVSSADELKQAMEQNNWTVDNEGNIVDASGTVVVPFTEAAKAYGEYYKETMEGYGKSYVDAVKNAGEDFANEIGAAGDAAKSMAGDAVEAAKDKADEAVNMAKEKANDEVNKAKAKANDEVNKAKAKANDEVNKALDKAFGR